MENLEIEIWLPIPGFEKNFEVSSFGRIRGLIGRNGKPRDIPFMRKLNTNKYGYEYVSLRTPGKIFNMLVHRAVLLAFSPNLENKTEVNHINGIKTDNRLINLEWSTRSENMLHSYALYEGGNPRKGEPGKIYGSTHHEARKVNQLDIKGNFIRQWDCIADAQRFLNVKGSGIGCVCRGTQKTAHGYKWEYAD